MKNYKKLVPIVLVVFSILSIYQLFNENMNNLKEYNENLKKARYCASVGIVDAADYYESALKYKPELSTYIEYTQFYIDQEEYSLAEEVAERISKAYPKNSEAYDLLMQIYDTNNDYDSLFNVYDETQHKKISSETIDKIYKKNEFKYYPNGKDYSNFKSILNGYYAVCNEAGYWGYCEKDGSSAIGCQYSYAGGFSSGMASVKNSDGELYYVNNENGKKFVFNSDQNYDYLGQMVNGMYVVGVNGKYSYYDTSFNKKFGDFEYAGTFNCGVASVKKDGKWMIIDTNGKVISDKYDEILMEDNDIACINNTIIAVKSNEYYILNEKGSVVKKTEFDEIAPIGSSNILAFKDGERWGFCDLNGKVLIKPEYDNAKSFSNGLAAVEKNGKWGYITEANKIAIEYKFAGAGNFNSSGSAFVSDDSETWTIIKLYKQNHS